MTVFLRLEDVLEIHRQVIEATGGSAGVRDVGMLDSAVHRPQASFGGAPLYTELPDQAAALFHSIAMNHPFADGNKRSAFTALDVFLRLNGVRRKLLRMRSTISLWKSPLADLPFRRLYNGSLPVCVLIGAFDPFSHAHACSQGLTTYPFSPHNQSFHP